MHNIFIQKLGFEKLVLGPECMPTNFIEILCLICISFSVNNIPGIEEVNMIKDDGSVIHFNNPKVP